MSCRRLNEFPRYTVISGAPLRFLTGSVCFFPLRQKRLDSSLMDPQPLSKKSRG